MKRSFTIAIVVIAVITVTLYAITYNVNRDQVALPKEIQRLELLAERGDTVALHKLLHFYDENSCEIIEIAEAVSPDGEDITYEVKSEQEELNTPQNKLYNQRLDYWLSKGISIDDPVAIYIKGMRLYYTDEANALPFLTQAALAGNGQAALFCGSTYFNHGDGLHAIKYLVIADSLGVPSAGWHLAMCYVGKAGVEQDLEKAIHFLVRSGLQDFPEAVLELRRIDTDNPLWQQKADSLKIDFEDFPIIPM